jgi:hypothetical protein
MRKACNQLLHTNPVHSATRKNGSFICPFKIIIFPGGMKVKTPGTGETAHQVQGIQINSGNQ